MSGRDFEDAFSHILNRTRQNIDRVNQSFGLGGGGAPPPANADGNAGGNGAIGTGSTLGGKGGSSYSYMQSHSNSQPLPLSSNSSQFFSSRGGGLSSSSSGGSKSSSTIRSFNADFIEPEAYDDLPPTKAQMYNNRHPPAPPTAKSSSYDSSSNNSGNNSYGNGYAPGVGLNLANHTYHQYKSYSSSNGLNSSSMNATSAAGAGESKRTSSSPPRRDSSTNPNNNYNNVTTYNNNNYSGSSSGSGNRSNNSSPLRGGGNFNIKSQPSSGDNSAVVEDLRQRLLQMEARENARTIDAIAFASQARLIENMERQQDVLLQKVEGYKSDIKELQRQMSSVGGNVKIQAQSMISLQDDNDAKRNSLGRLESWFREIEAWRSNIDTSMESHAKTIRSMDLEAKSNKILKGTSGEDYTNEEGGAMSLVDRLDLMMQQRVTAANSVVFEKLDSQVRYLEKKMASTFLASSSSSSSSSSSFSGVSGSADTFNGHEAVFPTELLVQSLVNKETRVLEESLEQKLETRLMSVLSNRCYENEKHMRLQVQSMVKQICDELGLESLSLVSENINNSHSFPSLTVRTVQAKKSLEKDFALNNAQIEEMKTKIKSLESKFSGIESSVTTDINRLEEAMSVGDDNNRQSVNELEGKLKGISVSAQDFETKMKDMVLKVKEELLSNLCSTEASFAGDVTGMDRRLVIVERVLEDIVDKVKLSSSIVESYLLSSNLSKRLESCIQKQTTADEQLRRIDGSLSSMNSNVVQRSDILRLEQKVNSHDNNLQMIEMVQNSLAANNQQVQTLEQDLQSNRKEFTSFVSGDFAASLKTIKDQIKEFETSIISASHKQQVNYHEVQFGLAKIAKMETGIPDLVGELKRLIGEGAKQSDLNIVAGAASAGLHTVRFDLQNFQQKFEAFELLSKQQRDIASKQQAVVGLSEESLLKLIKNTGGPVNSTLTDMIRDTATKLSTGSSKAVTSPTAVIAAPTAVATGNKSTPPSTATTSSSLTITANNSSSSTVNSAVDNKISPPSTTIETTAISATASSSSTTTKSSFPTAPATNLAAISSKTSVPPTNSGKVASLVSNLNNIQAKAGPAPAGGVAMVGLGNAALKTADGGGTANVTTASTKAAEEEESSDYSDDSDDSDDSDNDSDDYDSSVDDSSDASKGDVEHVPKDDDSIFNINLDSSSSSDGSKRTLDQNSGNLGNVSLNLSLTQSTSAISANLSTSSSPNNNNTSSNINVNKKDPNDNDNSNSNSNSSNDNNTSALSDYSNVFDISSSSTAISTTPNTPAESFSSSSKDASAASASLSPVPNAADAINTSSQNASIIASSSNSNNSSIDVSFIGQLNLDDSIDNRRMESCSNTSSIMESPVKKDAVIESSSSKVEEMTMPSSSSSSSPSLSSSTTAITNAFSGSKLDASNLNNLSSLNDSVNKTDDSDIISVRSFPPLDYATTGTIEGSGDKDVKSKPVGLPTAATLTGAGDLNPLETTSVSSLNLNDTSWTSHQSPTAPRLGTYELSLSSSIASSTESDGGLGSGNGGGQKDVSNMLDSSSSSSSVSSLASMSLNDESDVLSDSMLASPAKNTSSQSSSESDVSKSALDTSLVTSFSSLDLSASPEKAAKMLVPPPVMSVLSNSALLSDSFQTNALSASTATAAPTAETAAVNASSTSSILKSASSSTDSAVATSKPATQQLTAKERLLLRQKEMAEKKLLDKK